MTSKQAANKLTSLARGKDKARREIDSYLRSLRDGSTSQATWHQPRPDEWTISIAGSSQQTVNVELSLGEYTLQMMSFFMRGPDENKQEVLQLLLRRNLELSMVKFAIDDFGDIYLRADLPIVGVTPAELDRTVGILYATADSNYLPIMRLGFESSTKRPGR